MKKLLVFSLMTVVLLTGCGTKTLTCTTSEQASGLDMNQEVVAKFKGNKVQSIKVSVDSTATEDVIKENWDMFAEMLASEFEDMDAEGIEIKTENDKKNYSYKVSMEIDLNKASEEDLAKYDLDDIADKQAKIEDVKANAEKAGYTCK